MGEEGHIKMLEIFLGVGGGGGGVKLFFDLPFYCGTSFNILKPIARVQKLVNCPDHC